MSSLPPVPPTRRPGPSLTCAHLRSAWVPAAALAIFAVTATATFALRNDRVYGPIDGRALADCLAAVVLGACGAALGVALARFAPWRLVPVVAVFALLPAIVTLGSLGDPHWSNARQLSTWPRFPSDHDLLFTDPPVWWHLSWFAALGVLVGVIGYARVSRTRATLAAGLTAAVLVAGAGVAQTRPLSAGAAARLASLVAEPEQHQTCKPSERLVVCTYRGYEGYGDQVMAALTPVVVAAPLQVGRLTFRQRFDGDLASLGPEVRRAMRGRSAGGAGTLPLGYTYRPEVFSAARLRAGLAAVGLPVEEPDDDTPEVIAGKAPGVVALWIAARGLSPVAARQLATAEDFDDPNTTTDDLSPALTAGMAWPGPCFAGVPPVVWAAQDLIAARALLELPEDEVKGLLSDGWGTFTDPATTTDDLLVAAGLDPLGSADHVVAAPVRCTY